MLNAGNYDVGHNLRQNMDTLYHQYLYILGYQKHSCTKNTTVKVCGIGKFYLFFYLVL